MSRHRDIENKIYVGDLPGDASEKELERHFSSYGRLRNVWVARNPAGFAFVEYEDHRDAEDAVRGLDGTTICGTRVRVEHSSGKVRPKPWLRGGYRGGGGSRGGSSRGDRRDGGGGGGGGGGPRKGFNPDDRCYECNERGHYAYDCRKRSSRSYRSRSRSRSRGRDRSRSNDRRRSRRSPSDSRSRSRSLSKH